MNKNQRIALAEKNLQVKDLGFLLNLHPTYLSGILAGRHKASMTRKKVADILGKSESYLWPESDIN